MCNKEEDCLPIKNQGESTTVKIGYKQKHIRDRLWTEEDQQWEKRENLSDY